MEYINSEDITFKGNDLEPQTKINEPLAERIRTGFPEGEVDMDLIKQAFNDLSDMGFVAIGLRSQSDYGQIASKASLTRMGEKFLDFISKR